MSTYIIMSFEEFHIPLHVCLAAAAANGKSEDVRQRKNWEEEEELRSS